MPGYRILVCTFRVDETAARFEPRGVGFQAPEIIIVLPYAN